MSNEINSGDSNTKNSQLNVSKNIDNQTNGNFNTDVQQVSGNVSQMKSDDDKKVARQTAKQMYAQEGSRALDNENLSDLEKKELKKERAAQTNADVINAGAEVASSTNNPYAKAAGYTHKALNAATQGKYGEKVGEIAGWANRHVPLGGVAQSAINKFSESGAADKVGDAIAAKNGAAGEKAGEKVGEKAAEKAGEKAAEKAGEKVAEEASQKAAEKTAENKAKKAADAALDSASSESSSDEEFSFAKLLVNPIFWLFGGVGTVFIFLIIVAIVSVLTNRGTEYRDQFPYVKLEFSETINVKHNGEIKTMSLDEAAAGIVYAEVGSFADSEATLRAFAIIARTDLLSYMASSEYKNNGYFKSGNLIAYKPAGQNSKYLKAATDTHGVAILSGKIETRTKFKFWDDWLMFDAIAFKSKCGGSETDTSVTLCQKKVEVPISFLQERANMNHLRHLSDYQSHGEGASQWGAYYLAEEKGYNEVQIINLFYDKYTIISLYPPTTTSEITDENCKVNLKYKSTPDYNRIETKLKTFLDRKGTSIKSVNDEFLNEIKNAGPGTRCAVVTAGMYPILKLASYDAKLPYYWGGSDSGIYGLSPDWGTYMGNTKYDRSGLDCGTFIKWAYKNGGISGVSSQVKSNEHSKRKSLSSYDGQPGDILYQEGSHVMLVIKRVKSGGKDGYYVAQAAGKSYGNIKMNYVSMSYLKSSDYEIVDMSWYFENSKTKNFESAYQSKRKA